MPQVLLWVAILSVAAIAANSCFGILLVLLGPPAAPQTRGERWFIAFFGLQAAVLLKLTEWTSCQPFIKIALATGSTAVFILLFLQTIRIAAGETAIDIIGIFTAVWLASGGVAIAFLPRVFRTVRE